MDLKSSSAIGLKESIVYGPGIERRPGSERASSGLEPSDENSSSGSNSEVSDESAAVIMSK